MNNDCTAIAVAAEHREILPIFIREAQDILGHLPLQVAHLHTCPHKQEVLAAIRRGFHTLKGSSRMLGLEDFAAAAWEVEQVLNQRLQEGAPVDPGVLKLIGLAVAAFQGWIKELETRGQMRVASHPLRQMAQGLRVLDRE